MDTATSTDASSFSPAADTSVAPDAPSVVMPVIAPPPVTPRRKKGWGGLIGVLLIVLVIIAGAFYAWGERMARQEMQASIGA